MDDLEALKVRTTEILRRNSYWESCNDGSYEMALSNAGYYDLCKKIRELESELNIVRGYN